MEKKLSDFNDTTCIIQLEFSTGGKKLQMSDGIGLSLLLNLECR